MNIEKYILSFYILLSTMVCGQTFVSADFSFKVKFEKDIPVEELEISYFTKYNNDLTEIRYKHNISKNEIEIFGNHIYVDGTQFPTILFSQKEKKLFYTDTFREANKEERNTQNLFYLIIEHHKVENLNKEIKFSKEYPNIIISYKNENGTIWDVSERATQTYYEMRISNELVKVKPVE